MKALPNVEDSYAVELVRKAIHFASLSIPLVYYYIDKPTALQVLVPLLAVFGLSDILRLYAPSFGSLYGRFFGWILRPHERNDKRKRLNGATYVLLSAVLCIIIFPKVVFLTAFSILIISDSMAALIGRKFGRAPFLAKSRVGALAFFVSAVAVVMLTPKITAQPLEWLIGIAGAAVGTVVEALSISVDDNISIPVAIGAVMWLLYALLLPGVDIFALDKVIHTFPTLR